MAPQPSGLPIEPQPVHSRTMIDLHERLTRLEEKVAKDGLAIATLKCKLLECTQETERIRRLAGVPERRCRCNLLNLSDGPCQFCGEAE